jgi:alpha-beta hydrolase superfamily lysophospholipase
MEQRGIPDPPGRRLTWRDYYTVLRRPATDPYETSPHKAAWLAKYPEFARKLEEDWAEFLAALPPPDLDAFASGMAATASATPLDISAYLAELEALAARVNATQPLLLPPAAWKAAQKVGILTERDGKFYVGLDWVVQDFSGETPA